MLGITRLQQFGLGSLEMCGRLRPAGTLLRRGITVRSLKSTTILTWMATTLVERAGLVAALIISLTGSPTTHLVVNGGKRMVTIWYFHTGGNTIFEYSEGGSWL